jgi:DNA helicase INO80
MEKEEVAFLVARHGERQRQADSVRMELDRSLFDGLETYLASATVDGLSHALRKQLLGKLRQRRLDQAGKSAHSLVHERRHQALSRSLKAVNATVERIRIQFLSETSADSKDPPLLAWGEEEHYHHRNQSHSHSRDDDERHGSMEELWRHLSRNIVPQCSRTLAHNGRVQRSNARKVAGLAAREARRRQQRLIRLVKETGKARAKCVVKDVLVNWRRFERDERDLRRRLLKEAQERRRAKDEQREAIRQARKLNFLLQQTELYAHFIARKQPFSAIPSPHPSMSSKQDLADVDDALLAEEAARIAQRAVLVQQAHTASFDPRTALVDDPSKFVSQSDTIDWQEVRQPSLLRCTLKHYQLEGLRWLVSLYAQGINGILADEMGLGKTVQALALLAYLAETGRQWGPFLVITPSSTLHNWQQEFAAHLPAFRVLPYWGSPTERRILRTSLRAQLSSHPDVDDSSLQPRRFHVVITSYQLAVQDHGHLNKVPWTFLILDEAQAIKSAHSQRWQRLLQLRCRNRLLLTGTPLQNSLQELWALLHFVMPSLFDSHDEFAGWFARDLDRHADAAVAFDQEQLRRLQLVLKPFMLRRVKRDVEAEMPRKYEHDILVDLAPRQRALYDALRQRIAPVGTSPLAAKGTNFIVPSRVADDQRTLMNLVMQLRKVCNHPELLKEADVQLPFILDSPSNLLNLSREMGRKDPWFARWAAPYVSPPLKNQATIVPLLNVRFSALPKKTVDIECLDISFPPKAAPRALYPEVALQFENRADWIRVPLAEDLLRSSAKLHALDDLLRTLKRQGHRCLVYSQMTRMLDVLERYLHWRGLRYLRLDGSTALGDRRDLVHAWQNDDRWYVFLLSTRAGGLGLNLTAADTVIFYDPDWNPTVDSQAMDRAHRLGQCREVHVYRLISRGTVEERMRQRALHKHRIHQAVIDNGPDEDEDLEEAPIFDREPDLDQQDLVDLLQ